MRLVVRFLLFEFWLAWAMMLAGFIRVGGQIWPFLANSLMAGLRRRAWRVFLGLLIGLPVAAGWPLLFWLLRARPGYRSWFQAIAIPWWIVLGAAAFVLLVARAGEVGPRIEGRGSGCRCGTCVARQMDALPGAGTGVTPADRGQVPGSVWETGQGNPAARSPFVRNVMP